MSKRRMAKDVKGGFWSKGKTSQKDSEGSELLHPLLGEHSKTDILEEGQPDESPGRKKTFARFRKRELPRMVPMRIEPKTSFANERTFLRWTHMSIILGGVSSAMLGQAGPDDVDAHVIGLATLPLAIAMAAYACYLYLWRARQIQKKEARLATKFDDRIGPVCLACILVCLYITVFFYKLMGLKAIKV